MEIACSGFIYGLTVGAEPDPSRRIRAGAARRRREALARSRITKTAAPRSCSVTAPARSSSKRRSATIFWRRNSAATAAIRRCCYVPAGGTVAPLTSAGIADKQNKMVMKGREVFRFAVTKMIEATDAALAKAGLTRADIAYADPAPSEPPHHRCRRQTARDDRRQGRHHRRPLRQHQFGFDPDRAVGNVRRRQAQ